MLAYLTSEFDFLSHYVYFNWLRCINRFYGAYVLRQFRPSGHLSLVCCDDSAALRLMSSNDFSHVL